MLQDLLAALVVLALILGNADCTCCIFYVRVKFQEFPGQEGGRATRDFVSAQFQDFPAHGNAPRARAIRRKGARYLGFFIIVFFFLLFT